MDGKDYILDEPDVPKGLWDNILEKLKWFKFRNKFKNTYIDKIKFKNVLTIFMIFTIISLGYIGYKINEIKTRAFNVYIGDQLLGAIRTEEEAIPIIKTVKDNLSKKYGAKVVFAENIKFKSTHAKENKLLSKKELKNGMESKAGILVEGYSIKIDNEEVGVLKTKEKAENIIDKIKDSYMEDIGKDGDLKKSEFIEDIDIDTKQVRMEEISKEKELIEYIKTSGEDIKIHTVEAGESLWSIAEIYDIPIENLEKANKDINPTDLKPEDEVKLIVEKSKLTLETIEEIKYKEDIKYDTIIEKDKNMYKNQKKVKVEGAKGKNKIVANEIKHNGILVDKEIVSEKVEKEPIDKVIVQGTKEVPKTVATGRFTMPTRGRISSSYGRRWGRMHRGIDIAASHGTAVKAADGGTVSFAGHKGSYGKMVEINHGNGYKTRYAHCSAIHVKVGQKVAKGQHISNVGNTGQSTGPHLHLEVIKNGVHQNPSKYVK